MGGVLVDSIVSRIEQFYLQESSKCLLGQYLKKLASWESANSGRRSSDSHSRGAHRHPYLGCIHIHDLEGQSDLFKSASVDRIERFWTLCPIPFFRELSWTSFLGKDKSLEFQYLLII